MFHDLIVVEQLPVIRERLMTVGADIDKRISAALALECTDDNKQIVKSEKAALNKEFGELESRRKAVKTAVLAPYEQFEQVYKECVSDKFNAADAQLKAKIDAVEAEQKKRLEDTAKSYFSEYAQSKHIEFLTFERAGIRVGVSDNDTKLRKLCTAFIDRVADDLALIETQACKDEILVEYRASLNCSQAITTVAARHKAIEEQRARQAEADARKAAEAEAVKRVEEAIPAPLAPPAVNPVVEDDPIRTLAFRVTAPLSKLRELKRFLEEGGYEYQ